MWVEPIFTAGSSKQWMTCRESKIATLEQLVCGDNSHPVGCTCVASSSAYTSVGGGSHLLAPSPGGLLALGARRRGVSKDPGPQLPQFRIALKSAISHVIAVGKSIEEIHQNWNWIEANLLPQLEAFDLTESSSPDEIATMWQFVVLKFASLARESQQPEESGKEKDEDEEFGTLFQRMFGQQESEDNFVTCYSCELTRGPTTRRGHIYVTLSAIYFHSAMLSTRIKIPWEEITTILLRPLGEYLSSIIVTTTEEIDAEFMLSGFENSEEAYGLMTQLWDRTIDLLMQEVTSLKGNLSLCSNSSKPLWQSRQPRQTFLRTTGSNPDLKKRALESQRTQQKYARIFRIPNTETVQGEHICRWNDGNQSLKGHLMVTNNYLCFQSDPMEEAILVIPLSGLTKAKKELRRLSGCDLEEHVISIDVPPFQFSFLSPNCMTNVYCLLLSVIDKNMRLETKEIINFDARTIPQSQPDFIGLEGVAPIEYFIRQNDQLHRLFAYFEGASSACLGLRTRTLRDILVTGGGLPDCLRGKLWQAWAGSCHYLASQPGEYEKLLNRAEAHSHYEEILHDIDKDLHRSFPQHPFFNTSEGLSSLRRILVTYSCQSQSGYVQSMNLICAFLRVFMSEEETYWLFYTICEQLLPEHYSSNPSMLGAVLSQRVMSELLLEEHPTLARHLYSLSVPIPVIGVSWFTTLFIGRLNLEATVRVLDWFFYKGRLGLIQIALAIFKTLSSLLLETHDPIEISLLMKDELVQLNPDELLKIACSEYEKLPQWRLDELWRKHKYAVMEDTYRKCMPLGLQSNHLKMEPKPTPSPQPDHHRSSILSQAINEPNQTEPAVTVEKVATTVRIANFWRKRIKRQKDPSVEEENLAKAN